MQGALKSLDKLSKPQNKHKLYIFFQCIQPKESYWCSNIFHAHYLSLLSENRVQIVDYLDMPEQTDYLVYWFLTFVMLQPLSQVSHVVMTPNNNIIFVATS